METQSPVPPKQQQPEETKEMSFYQALPFILEGKHITRISWNSNEEYGFIGPDRFLWIHTKGQDHQWGLHETDMIATDWILVKLMN